MKLKQINEVEKDAEYETGSLVLLVYNKDG